MATALLDRDTVEQAIRDEPGARDRLMEASLPMALAWCMRLGGPKVDAEDAAHDALMIVWTRITSLNTPERYTAWLYGIVRRVLAAHRRRAWVRRWVPGAEADGVDRGPSPARVAQQSELVRGVQEAIEKLPPKQREVLVLCELEERSDVEVAELLGVPLGTVKSRLRLARARFAQAAARLHLDEQIPGRELPEATSELA
jgi:RNA polymerase sigma-70 factor (ECF subfamily)